VKDSIGRIIPEKWVNLGGLDLKGRYSEIEVGFRGLTVSDKRINRWLRADTEAKIKWKKDGWYIGVEIVW